MRTIAERLELHLHSSMDHTGNLYHQESRTPSNNPVQDKPSTYHKAMVTLSQVLLRRILLDLIHNMLANIHQTNLLILDILLNQNLFKIDVESMKNHTHQ